MPPLDAAAAGHPEPLRRDGHDNLVEAFEKSDDPEMLKSKLIWILDTYPDVLVTIVRRGVSARIDCEKNMAMQFGVVGALILSVVVGMCTSRLDVSLHDDGFSHVREDLANVYSFATSCAAVTSVCTVFLSILMLTMLESHIQDIEDALWLLSKFSGNAVIGLFMYISVFLIFFSIIIAAVVQLPEKLGIAFIVLFCALFLVVTIWAVRGFTMALKHSTAGVAKNRDRWLNAIETAFSEVVASKSSTDGVLQAKA